jgi:hypothetical protein
MENSMIRVDAREPVHIRPVLEVSSTAGPTRLSQFTRSTIAPCVSKEVGASSVFRPVLCPPEPHFIWGIMRVYQEMESLALKESVLCERDTKAALDRLIELDKKKVEMFADQAKKLESRRSWAIFETVAQYITSCSSIIIGLSISGVVPVAGGFLIAAGGLGLLNRAISDSGGWEWLLSRFTASCDLQIKIASHIDSTLVYLSTALSICSAIGAYHAGALSMFYAASRNEVMNKALQTISTAGSFLQATTRFNIAKQDRNILRIGANLKIAQSNSFSARQEIQTHTANLRKIIELSEKISEIVKESINSSII